MGAFLSYIIGSGQKKSEEVIQNPSYTYKIIDDDCIVDFESNTRVEYSQGNCNMTDEPIL